jgi:DNA-binding NarL/FixJ family response regulator
VSVEDSAQDIGVRQREMVVRLAVECATLAAAGEAYDVLLLNELHRIIGLDNGGLINHIDTSLPVGSRIAATATDGRTATAYVLPYEQDALLDEIGRGSHPVVGAMERGERFETVRVSDVISMPKLWGSEFYRVTWGQVDARYALAFQLQMRENRKICAFLTRTHADFTPGELELVELLRRPVASAIAFRADLDDVVNGLYGGLSHLAPRSQELDSLTPRQREVLALLARGWTNSKIGSALGITERTVRKHVGDVCERLHVSNRAAAAATWARLRSRKGRPPGDDVTQRSNLSPGGRPGLD